MAENTKLPIIRGSTLDIWLGLYINVMDAKDISVKNPTLRTLVKTDAKIAGLKEPLAQPFEVEELGALTTTALTKLKAVTNTEVKRIYQLYDAEFQVIKPNITKVITTREKLLAEYKEIVQDQNLSAKEILAAIKAKKEADKNKVRELVKHENEFEQKVKTLEADAKDLLPKAQETYTKTYQLIPEADRNIPPPEDLQRRPT